MDINKEREAFEKAMKSRSILDLDYVQYHEISNKYVIQSGLKGEYFKTALDCSHVVNIAWMMWQDKAAPEGFVLVPREPTQDMMIAALAVISTGIGKDHIDVEIIQCWKKMIEAQEQSHD